MAGLRKLGDVVHPSRLVLPRGFKVSLALKA
jgi:hypothetical protein